MDVIEQLSVALGFATLAGLNLYLVVLVTGLAIRLDLLTLASQYDQLSVLGEWPVIGAAAVFFVLEFFSDKIPWVDSLWDSIHTLVRPVGGAVLAVRTLGLTDPQYEVIVALLAGGVTLVTHGAKASTRLAVNTSPEPFSNVAVSTAEDTAVLAGLGLMLVAPVAAGLVFSVFLFLAALYTPRLFRRVKATAWLLSKKIFSTGQVEPEKEFRVFGSLAVPEQLTIRQATSPESPEVLWTVKCVTGRVRAFKGLNGNRFGRLVADGKKPGRLLFVGRSLGGWYYVWIPLEGLAFRHETRFLSEDIELYQPEGKQRIVLRFTRGQHDLAERVLEQIMIMKRSVPSSQPRSAAALSA